MKDASEARSLSLHHANDGRLGYWLRSITEAARRGEREYSVAIVVVSEDIEELRTRGFHVEIKQAPWLPAHFNLAHFNLPLVVVTW